MGSSTICGIIDRQEQAIYYDTLIIIILTRTISKMINFISLDGDKTSFRKI